MGRLALARDARDRPSRSADGGGRRRRRDLEPDDLREGALDGRLVRRAAARRSSSAPTTRRRCSSRSPWRTSSAPAICSCRCGSAPDGVDGFVSIEVDPDLAYERQDTFEQATLLHELVDRKNVYVKIPATEPGIGAIEDSIAAGRSINVTLIFSLDRYSAVAEAYVRGLERLVEGGGDPTHVASVASFFVSRVDTECDRRLAEIGRDDIQGRLAVDNAKLAYERYARDLLRGALGGPRRRGCTSAALPVGVDLDEEPGVSGRPLRRGADRAGHGEHDAVRDDRRRSRITASCARAR